MERTIQLHNIKVVSQYETIIKEYNNAYAKITLFMYLQ